jgi:hypothetical protein
MTLSHYVTIQMNINPIQSDPTNMRVPQTVKLILTQLEMLKLGRIFSTEKILSSFFDLDNREYFEQSWDDVYESRLKITKEQINKFEFKVSSETDTRVLCQILLDFLEHLSEPGVSELTVHHLAKLNDRGMSSNDILSRQMQSESIGDRLGSLVTS